MTFDVTNWNIDENIDWYVRLEDTGVDITVGLYKTESDAQHDNNRVAQATGIAYGTDSSVTLVVETGYTLELFQIEYTWHLKVTGANGYSAKVYKISRFTDLPSITHSIFSNVDLIALKAKDEVDKHTHAQIKRDMPLGTHIPDIKVGDVVTINSTRRGINEVNQIVNHTIIAMNRGSEVQLTSNITTIKYLEMTKS